MDVSHSELRVDRRRAIGRMAAGAGAVWAAPAVIGVGDVAGAASPATCESGTVTTDTVTFEATGWRQRQVPQDTDSDFYQGAEPVGFTDGEGAFGDYGLVGDSPEVCAENGETRPASTTIWADGTDLELRRSIAVPAQTQLIEITVRYDNFATVWWDGQQLASFPNGGFCGDERTTQVPANLCAPGNHLLAILGENIPDSEKYLDAQVRITTCA